MENGQPLTGTEGEGGAAPPEPAAGTGGKKKRRIHRPALIARFPKLFWHPSLDARWANDWPVVPPEQPGEYPELAADLAVWREQLEPRFRRLDHRAQILQNQFWRQHVALIVGGLVATALGTIQAAAGGGVVLIAVAEAVLTGALAGLTVLIRSRRAQRGYFTDRLKAERIKSEFFLFLARVGDYSTGNPVARLLQQVDDIEAAEGVS
jgi:hypothetical protein